MTPETNRVLRVCRAALELQAGRALLEDVRRREHVIDWQKIGKLVAPLGVGVRSSVRSRDEATFLRALQHEVENMSDVLRGLDRDKAHGINVIKVLATVRNALVVFQEQARYERRRREAAAAGEPVPPPRRWSRSTSPEEPGEDPAELPTEFALDRRGPRGTWPMGALDPFEVTGD